MVSPRPRSPDPILNVRDIANTYGADVEFIHKDAIIVRSDEWHAHFWWDFVPKQLRVRLIGNYRQAARDWHRWTDIPDIRTAMDLEVHRLDNVPWGSTPLPGKRKERKRTATTETIETKGRLTFGDLPLGWRRARKAQP